MLFPYSNHYAHTVVHAILLHDDSGTITERDVLKAIHRSCAGKEDCFHEYGAFDEYLRLFNLQLVECAACREKFVTHRDGIESEEVFCSFQECYMDYIGE